MRKENRRPRWSRNSPRSFGRASIALVSEYRGMTAGESTEMRRRMRAVRGELRVAKNTLVRRAIKDTTFAALDGQLGGPVGLILSYRRSGRAGQDRDLVQELGEKFKLRGGVLDGKPLSGRGSPGAGDAAAARSDLGAVARAAAGAGDAVGAPAQRAGLVRWRGWSTRLARRMATRRRRPAAPPPSAPRAAPTDAPPSDAPPTGAAPSEATPGDAAERAADEDERKSSTDEKVKKALG